MLKKNPYTIAAIGLLVISLLPWIFLAFHAQPQFDDYFLAIITKELGLLEHMKSTYLYWSGRYFSTLLPFLLLHGDYSLGYYTVFPLIWLSVSLLLIHIFVSRYWQKGFDGWLITLVIFFLQLSLLPSPADALYWFTGALAYFVPWLLTLAFWARAIREGPQPRGRRWLWHTLNAMLLIAIAGSNELSIYVMFCYMIAVGFLMRRSREIIPRHFYLYFAIYLLATMVMVAAPGNYHRLDLLPDSFNWSLSFFEGTKTSVYFLWRLLRSPLFWTGSLLIIYFLKTHKPSFSILDIYFQKTPIWVSLALSFLFVYGFYVLSWLILGSLVIDRQHNILSVSLWPIIIIHLYGVARRYETRWENLAAIPHIQTLLFFLMLWFGVSDIYFSPGERPVRFHNSMAQVWHDYLSGEAAKYAAQHRTYHKLIIQHPDHEPLVLPALQTKPRSLFVKELSTDTANPYNDFFARYWNLQAVKSELTP